MVDIVHRAFAVADLDQRAQHVDNVFISQDAVADDVFAAEAAIELHAAYSRQVVALAGEEQIVEQILSSFFCRRLTRTHHPVNLDQRFERLLVGSMRSVSDTYGPQSRSLV